MAAIICSNECNDWIKSMHQITNGQSFLAISRGWEYTGEVFRFCPWCGELIKEVPVALQQIDASWNEIPNGGE